MELVKSALQKIKGKMPPDIQKAHEHSFRNREELLRSDVCGCFYCEKTFANNEIFEWVDEGGTAMCPKCGIDSVIGSASEFPVTPAFLKEMNQYWF